MSAQGFVRRHALRTALNHPTHAPRIDVQRWYDPDFAPLNTPLAVQARDALGSYTLPMKCVRTSSGWISHHFKARLHVTVTGWRYEEHGVRG